MTVTTSRESMPVSSTIFSTGDHRNLAAIIGEGFVYTIGVSKNKQRWNIQQTTSSVIRLLQRHGYGHFNTAMWRDSENLDILPLEKAFALLTRIPTRSNLEIDLLNLVIVIGRELIVAKLVITTPKGHRRISWNRIVCTQSTTQLTDFGFVSCILK